MRGGLLRQLGGVGHHGIAFGWHQRHTVGSGGGVFGAVATRLQGQAPMVYIMPGLLYSGLSWPNFDMSSIASVLGMLMPMTYGGDTLRDILLNGTAPTLYTNCKIMLLGGIGCQLVAAGLFYLRRRFHIWTDEAGTANASGTPHINEGKGEHDETSAGNEA